MFEVAPSKSALKEFAFQYIIEGKDGFDPDSFFYISFFT